MLGTYVLILLGKDFFPPNVGEVLNYILSLKKIDTVKILCNTTVFILKVRLLISNDTNQM